MRAGEVIGLVGESGSGKSMTAQSIMRLLPHAARPAGSIRFAGEELLSATENRMCELRGDDIGMVFQEPMTALNPVKTIGEQVAEGIRFHRGLDRAESLDRAAIYSTASACPRPGFRCPGTRTNSPAGSVSASSSPSLAHFAPNC